MQYLGLALRARGEEGEPLKSPILSLDTIGAKFRRGQTSLIAAAPGGGKSALAAYFAVHSGAPTLYFSADCDRMTISKAIGAGVLKTTQEKIEALLVAEDSDTYRRIGEATKHIWFSFEPTLDLRDVYEEVEGYAMVHGAYPELIVVDNLMDVSADGDEKERFTDTVVALNDLARSTGAHVMILCHVTGFWTDGMTPIPRSGIYQKVDKKSRLILTLFQVSDGLMGVRVVKNTSGSSKADATYGIDLPWLPARGWFGV